MSYKVPTLSTDGALTDNDLKVSRLFTYFLVADRSQTYFYTDNVQSLKFIVSQFKNDNDLITMIKDSLQDLYNRYFKDTEVHVKLDHIEEDSAAVVVNIELITYTVDTSTKLTLTRAITLENNMIKYYDENIDQLYRGRR